MGGKWRNGLTVIAKGDSGKAVLAIYIKFYPPFITNKMKRISFKGGCVVQVAKHLKGDWFIVLR